MGLNISIIPAKGRPEKIPRKSIKIIHDKPLIAYSIESEQPSRAVGRVIVYMDGNEITDILKSCGAVFIMRLGLIATETPLSNPIATDQSSNFPL